MSKTKGDTIHHSLVIVAYIDRLLLLLFSNCPVQDQMDVNVLGCLCISM